MQDDAIYDGEREVRTYADLNHAANVLIKKSEESEKGSFYTVMSSLILTAFTFEAYLNHLGEATFDFWEEIEFTKILNKHSILCKQLNISPDFSRRPYQTLKALFKFRNTIAHGKSKIMTSSKEVSADSDPFELGKDIKTEWEEYCTLENAKKAKEDIEEIIIELNDEAGLGKHPFIHGMTIGSLSIKTSKE